MVSITRTRPPVAIACVSLMMLVVAATSCSQDSQEDNSDRNEAGTVVGGGDVGVFALRVGDCIDVSQFTDQTEAASTATSEVAVTEVAVTEVEEFAAVPCSETHSGEVVTNDEQFFADLDAFPTSDELLETGRTRCITDLSAYTATDYETSPYDIIPLIPTENSWDVVDDRGLICIGVTLNDELTEPIDSTESMKAAG
jgi:Septum formation